MAFIRIATLRLIRELQVDPKCRVNISLDTILANLRQYLQILLVQLDDLQVLLNTSWCNGFWDNGVASRN